MHTKRAENTLYLQTHMGLMDRNGCRFILLAFRPRPETLQKWQF